MVLFCFLSSMPICAGDLHIKHVCVSYRLLPMLRHLRSWQGKERPQEVQGAAKLSLRLGGTMSPLPLLVSNSTPSLPQPEVSSAPLVGHRVLGGLRNLSLCNSEHRKFYFSEVKSPGTAGTRDTVPLPGSVSSIHHVPEDLLFFMPISQGSPICFPPAL